MLNELVHHVKVHQAEKIDGVWVQKFTIHYNCVDIISVPDKLAAHLADITMNTRRGIYVSYAPPMEQHAAEGVA